MEQRRVVEHELLGPIQHLVARYSVCRTFRGQPSGTEAAAYRFLHRLDLGPFGTRDRDSFSAVLDEAAEALQVKLPSGSWGFARKCVNIFLRDCLYNVYLREHYQLGRAEYFFEVVLDSIVAKQIRAVDTGFPKWPSIKDLDCSTSELYQSAAAEIAEANGYARVHLDAVWWGRRKD